jgi:hypothetical protein
MDTPAQPGSPDPAMVSLPALPDGGRVALEAYAVSATENWTLSPCKGNRDWMDASQQKFAYRCLPLVMANQAGWILTCPLRLRVVWDGSERMQGLSIDFPQGEGINAGQVRSHFGMGILTFSIPWLFRTSPGYGLWVKGPSNMPRDGLFPLEGIVETDWAPYTFTMNWKVTRPNQLIEFAVGEPIAMIVPFPLDMLESVEPAMRSMQQHPALAQDYASFHRERAESLQRLRATSEPAWSMSYMKGRRPDGSVVQEHRKAFALKSFA